MAGATARGAVSSVAGGFAVYAAVRFDPTRAKGVDDTLRSFADIPARSWLLVTVAVGLTLSGDFSRAMAARRRI
ncbi:DUF1206 domain-containing protein [Streptomyces sp. NPDC058289]|uniref:DUF1206 domain-containing protein n=1 Tax=Streptomyces sp. NPDC058289 TaxID=3346425 RepID=UPI0036E0CC09